MILRGRELACGFQSQGQQDAATLQRQTAEESQNLFNIGEPSLKQTRNDFSKDLGTPGSEPGSVQNAFSQIRGQQDAQFAQAEDSSTATINQEAKQSGYRGARGSVENVASNTLYNLEGRRKAAIRQLQEQE